MLISALGAHFISVVFLGVFGRVTKRSLRNEMGLDSASDQYSIGDVVSCQVVQVKKKWKRRQHGIYPDDTDAIEDEGKGEQRPYYEITLSLRESAERSNSKEQEAETHIRTGAVLPAKSLRVLEFVRSKLKDGALVPGFAIVEVKAKHIVRENIVGDKIECKLSFDQLFDEYDEAWLRTPRTLDHEAAKVLTVGEKINRKSLVLTDPKKSSADFKSGTGRLTLISLRPKLVELVDQGEDAKMMMPGPETEIFVGAQVAGYVCHIDPRYGGFIRFLDGLTGLVPKLKGGCKVPLYATMMTKIIAIDVAKTPPKILLGKASMLEPKSETTEEANTTPGFGYSVGDTITRAEVEKVDFHRAIVKLSESVSPSIQVRIHCTMAPFQKADQSSLDDIQDHDGTHPLHPFYKWTAGVELPPLKVIAIQRNRRRTLVDVQLTSPADVNKNAKNMPEYLEGLGSLKKGQKVSGIVGSTGSHNHGIWVLLGPNLSGFLPALEISDVEGTEIPHVSDRFPKGTRVTCYVSRVQKAGAGEPDRVNLTLMNAEFSTPAVGDTILGMVTSSVPARDKPALMVELRGGMTGRCCITELCDHEEWTNLPFGRREWQEDDIKTDKG